MAGTPELSQEQRAAALVKATAVRMARRRFKQSLSDGEIGFGEAVALAKADEALAGIRAHDLLQCLPGVGPKRASDLMADIGIAATRRVRGLGEHQVASLVARVRK